jgi:flagellar motility protein MotE (MotC chaperone)
MKFNVIVVASGILFSVCMPQPSSAEAEPLVSNAAVTQNETDFCRAFSDKAAEAKLQRHKKGLLDLEAKINEQLLVLDQKTKQLKELTAKREEYRSAVSSSIVKIYSNVEPEVAAQQLEKLSVEMASEVLQRLNPKISGEIVTAMDVKLASKIVKLMLANAAKANEKAEKP